MARGDPKPIGEAHYCAKLTEAAVRAIRKSGETISGLAEAYGVSRPTLRSAKFGRTWKHVSDADNRHGSRS